MSKHLQRDMDEIRRRLLALFGVAEKMIDNAVRALCEQKQELVDEVLASDDYVDEQEVLIEEECLKILALHQPVAGNLRIVAAVLKINADLERIADLACNIAERAQSLCQFPDFPMPDELPQMASATTEMLRLAIDAFVNMNSSLAEHVILMDNRIDQMNRDVIDLLRGIMQDSPALIEPALHSFSATRNIERIGDLAESIAGDVVYIVKGEIVRHRPGSLSTQPPSPETQNKESYR